MHPLLPFIIVFLEGYTTLAVQMIVLRLAAPVIGTNVVATSIVIGVMLIALSTGYWRGGEISSQLSIDRIRGKLAKNFFLSGVLFGIGLPLFAWANSYFLDTTGNYFIGVFLASTLVLALPVYLASETTPLVSELIKNIGTGQAVGRLIFFSTMGSFLGSVATTIIFFPLIGVTRNIALVVLIFGVLTLLIVHSKRYILAGVLLVVLSSSALITDIRSAYTIFAASTPYQDISIYESTYGKERVRIFSLDGAYSSGIMPQKDGSWKGFPYIEEAIRITQERQPRRILVIGWAWFVYPQMVSRFDFVESIDVSDVDPSLAPTAEAHLLHQKLSSKITAYSLGGARYYLSQTDKKYDLILVDAYAGKSLPQELVSKEFFSALSGALTSSGGIIFNAILDPWVSSDAAINILSTMRWVYGTVWYNSLAPTARLSNVIVSTLPYSRGIPYIGREWKHYSDDVSSASLDIAEMLRKSER